MRAILNASLKGENDCKVVKPKKGLVEEGKKGRLRITQAFLEKLQARRNELEELADLMRKALMGGADIEDGLLDCGLFVESKREPDWRLEAVAAGVDPDEVMERLPKLPGFPSMKVFVAGQKQDGERVAPTDDGAPARHERG